MSIWRRLPLFLLLLLGCPPVAATMAGAGAAPASVEGVDRILAVPGGRRIALRCSGRGRFTIIVEPGDGGRRAHMRALSAVLAKRYRVCAYDRRNVGRSSSAPLPRKAADLRADVFDALAAAHVQGPYILFGSSMGGLLVRSYARAPAVAGLVTSNQPGTQREWMRFAFPSMSASQRAVDTAWMAGNNHEHIDVNDLSRSIDDAGAPSIPHIIMISTERFQCKAAALCGPIYRAFVAASREAARGRKGRLRIVDGEHDLYVSNLNDVVAAIDEVASAAANATGSRRPAR